MIEIIARSGVREFVPLLACEEEVVFKANLSIDEIAKLFSGKILRLEGENCLFIPKNPPSEAIKLIKSNKKFKKWWKRAALEEFGGEKGKIFIIRET